MQSIEMLRGKKILIVDDESNILGALENIADLHDSLRQGMETK